jgi:hypothetical protein
MMPAYGSGRFRALGAWLVRGALSGPVGPGRGVAIVVPQALGDEPAPQLGVSPALGEFVRQGGPLRIGQDATRLLQSTDPPADEGHLCSALRLVFLRTKLRVNLVDRLVDHDRGLGALKTEAAGGRGRIAFSSSSVYGRS